MKLNLRKIAIGATITGISFVAVSKMFHVKRPKVGSYDYSSKNSSTSNMAFLGEEHFVVEKPKTRILEKCSLDEENGE